MIISMTGYGKAAAELPGKKVLIEIKSLNSKGLDLSVKLPGAFREKELEVRNLLSQRLDRGKIELFVSMEKSADSPVFSINKSLLLEYHKELKSLLSELQKGFSNLKTFLLGVFSINILQFSFYSRSFCLVYSLNFLLFCFKILIVQQFIY